MSCLMLAPLYTLLDIALKQLPVLLMVCIINDDMNTFI